MSTGKRQKAGPSAAASATQPLTSDSTSAPGGARILVVDDHAMNCELLEALLVPQGYRVETAYSGPEALQAVAHRAPDLVLLDVSMPGMDGFEVARRLRAAPDTRLVPIVMVTALGDLEHRVRGLESGAEDYLSKPVNRTELLARVQATLKLSYYRRQVDERQKLDLVLADVTNGILIVDAEARLREANQAARRLLGLGEPPLGGGLGTVWGEMQGVPAELEHEARAGRAQDFVVHRPQPPLYLGVTLRPVHDLDGHPTGAVVSMRDVTRETLENRLQEDALSLVSHKFRTPLTIVGLWTKLLLEGECGPVNEQQREALTAMLGASDQLRRLLEGMLSYLEWTRRLHRLHRQPMSFAELEGILQHRVREEVLGDYRLKIERRTDDEIVVDGDLFVEAIVELVRNAVKFERDKVVHVTIEMSREHDKRLVVVQDDGPGIPPEKLERIFERFYQVEAEFTGQVQGIGLGLALVKIAVEALGGSIQVTSRLGQGTRFEITF